MELSSRKPLTTYSRRRGRHGEAAYSASQSSPIQSLGPDKEEVSFAVMANRMNKRARMIARSTTTEADSAETLVAKCRDDRPKKRQKPASICVGDKQEDTGYMRDVYRPNDSQVYTPDASMRSEQSMTFSPSVQVLMASDRLSPLPVAKRIPARTTSRNFKENGAGHLASRFLASPFSSRPGSRSSTPDPHLRGTQKRLIHHIKSRTLSQLGVLKEKTVYPNTPAVISGVQSQLATTDPAGSMAHPKSNVPTHHRSSSTPTVRPALESITSGSWFVPPRLFPRQPGTDFEVEDTKPGTVVDHPSFFLDAPEQISTPPRRRRSATVGVWVHGLMPQLDADPPPPVRNFPYDSDVDMSDSSPSGSPSGSSFSRPDSPRRRRRTIVHLSSDSLFSSSFNFSALMSETERFPRPPASEGSRSPRSQLQAAQSDLEPAFSLDNSPPSSHKLRNCSDRNVATTLPHTGSSIFVSSSVPSGRRSVLSNPSSSSSGSSSLPAQASPDLDDDELLDLFSVLGLDEDEKWLLSSGVDDSGVAFPSQPRNLSSKSTKAARVRRKRGDTIRASDLAKRPASGSSAFFDSSSTCGNFEAQLPLTRRTRSGTVTQASNPGAPRRKHEGWPTIKMRMNVEPLRVGENEDDELLLKDGDVIE